MKKNLSQRIVVWPWHSVFWKIFAWFWFTMVSVLLTLFVALAVTVDPSDLLPERQALLKELNSASVQMEKLSQSTLHLPIPRFPGSGYFLFDTSGNVLGSAPISEELLTAYNKTREQTTPSIMLRRGVLVVGPQHLKLKDADFELYLTKEAPVLVQWRVNKVITKQWPLIILALIVTFILSVVLARYFVGPIRNLQRMSRRLASGDLNTRAEPKASKRRDELGELARDFDHMAEQFAYLISSKERLLRDVSHELRSPLTRLQISLALARRKTPDAEAEHARIEREIERLNQLIGQIIHFSRIHHKITDTMCSQVSLDAVIAKLVDDADFEAQASGSSVVVTQTVPLQIVGVEEFLASAIENIIRNAIRFTPEDTEIEVSLQQEENNAVIRIRDYGLGVPKEALEDLFEPFFRVDETRGKENNGSGLGMAIASAAIKQHGGMIVAHNRNPGLEVTITLPLQSRLSG